MAKTKSTSKIDLSKYVLTAEAARRSGYHQRHIRLLAERGEIEGIKLNSRSWLVNLDSLLAYKKRLDP